MSNPESLYLSPSLKTKLEERLSGPPPILRKVKDPISMQLSLGKGISMRWEGSKVMFTDREELSPLGILLYNARSVREQRATGILAIVSNGTRREITFNEGRIDRSFRPKRSTPRRTPQLNFFEFID